MISSGSHFQCSSALGSGLSTRFYHVSSSLFLSQEPFRFIQQAAEMEGWSTCRARAGSICHFFPERHLGSHALVGTPLSSVVEDRCLSRRFCRAEPGGWCTFDLVLRTLNAVRKEPALWSQFTPLFLFFVSHAFNDCCTRQRLKRPYNLSHKNELT